MTEVEKLRTENEELKAQPLSIYTAFLLKAMNHALAVIGFAIANNPPEDTAGWPAEDLYQFTELLDLVCAIDKRYAVVMQDWRNFAGECRESEKIRAEKKRRAPRAKPATAKQLAEMARKFDETFGEGAIAARFKEKLGVLPTPNTGGK